MAEHSRAVKQVDRSADSRGEKPTLAVWKFTSCDGCQLSLLDCEDELLTLADAIEISYFMEASSAVQPGPYDLSLVEGSVSTPAQLAQIREIRAQSRVLVTIGACANAGGIQALRNFAEVEDFIAAVYAEPQYIDTLATSTPISAHVPVDFELQGCPINKRQLLEVISAFLARRPPQIPAHSVCVECKLRGTVCVWVARGTPCMGPVTHAGCGAICPAYNRGCYACFGPKENANTESLCHWWREELEVEQITLIENLRNYNAAAPLFESASRREQTPGSSGDTNRRDGRDEQQ